MIYKGKFVVLREFKVEHPSGGDELSSFAVWDGPFSTLEAARAKAEECAAEQAGVSFVVATMHSGLRIQGEEELC
jgi:hypothetical protein